MKVFLKQSAVLFLMITLSSLKLCLGSMNHAQGRDDIVEGRVLQRKDDPEIYHLLQDKNLLSQYYASISNDKVIIISDKKVVRDPEGNFFHYDLGPIVEGEKHYIPYLHDLNITYYRAPERLHHLYEKWSFRIHEGQGQFQQVEVYVDPSPSSHENKWGDHHYKNIRGRFLTPQVLDSVSLKETQSLYVGVRKLASAPPSYQRSYQGNIQEMPFYPECSLFKLANSYCDYFKFLFHFIYEPSVLERYRQNLPFRIFFNIHDDLRGALSALYPHISQLDVDFYNDTEKNRLFVLNPNLSKQALYRKVEEALISNLLSILNPSLLHHKSPVLRKSFLECMKLFKHKDVDTQDGCYEDFNDLKQIFQLILKNLPLSSLSQEYAKESSIYTENLSFLFLKAVIQATPEMFLSLNSFGKLLRQCTFPDFHEKPNPYLLALKGLIKYYFGSYFLYHKFKKPVLQTPSEIPGAYKDYF